MKAISNKERWLQAIKDTISKYQEMLNSRDYSKLLSLFYCPICQVTKDNTDSFPNCKKCIYNSNLNISDIVPCTFFKSIIDITDAKIQYDNIPFPKLITQIKLRRKIKKRIYILKRYILKAVQECPQEYFTKKHYKPIQWEYDIL